VRDDERSISREQLDEVLQWLLRLAEFAATEARTPLAHLFNLDSRGWGYAVIFKSGAKQKPSLRGVVQEWWQPAIQGLTARVGATIHDASFEARAAACKSIRSFVHVMTTIVMKWGAGSEGQEWRAQAARDAEPECAVLEAKLHVPPTRQ